jgi:uncharacterized protein
MGKALLVTFPPKIDFSCSESIENTISKFRLKVAGSTRTCNYQSVFMNNDNYREAIEAYIRLNANPPDKFSHQPRLYRLCTQLASEQPHDDDILHAAAWLHDLGVFIGHRPDDSAALANWDCVAYAMEKTPALLDKFGFPRNKIAAVVEAIRTHQPSAEPTTFEGIVLRDADILEQLGAISILRTVSKVGRDTRFVLFSDALRVLRRNTDELSAKMRLDITRRLAHARIEALKAFLAASEMERGGTDW